MTAPPQRPGSRREIRATYANLLRLRDWAILVPLAIVGIGLGAWGFELCGPNDKCHVDSLLIAIGRSVLMLRGSFQYQVGQAPAPLIIAQYMLPLLVIFGGIKLLLLNIRRDMRVVLASRRRNHVIICGLGDTGREVAENLRAKGTDVVAIVLDADEPHAIACEQLKIPILKGDAAQFGMLGLAGLRHAQGVVVTTGSDAVNVEIALRVEGELAAGRGTGKRRFYVLPEVRSAWLIGLLHTYPTSTLGSERVEIRPFDLNANAARLLLERPTFRRAFPPRADGATPTRPHLLIAGLGEMSTHVILQAAQCNYALPGCRLAVTVFDQQGKDAAAPLAARFPGLMSLVDIDFVQTAFDADNPATWPEVWQDVEAMLRGRDEALSTVAVIVSLGKDKDSLHTALQLRARLDRLGEFGTPVFVRLQQQRALGQFAARLDGADALLDRLIPFGDLAELTSPVLLIDQIQDLLARAIHETYLASRPANARRSAAAVPWSMLPERFKQSNRAVADHLPAKLGLVGMRLVPGDEPPAEFTDAEVETMAAAEHGRWMIERFTDGWTLGPLDEVGRVHPDLTAWDQLLPEMREANRRNIRAIPENLRRVNLTVRRERIIVAVGRGLADAAANLTALRADELAIVVFDPLDAGSWQFALDAAAGSARLWVLWREGSRLPPKAPSPPTDAVRDAIEAAISARDLAALVSETADLAPCSGTTDE
ncbi:MAG TPA: NAD(P)-binding protein [Stellaceae bacterium]|nr:NAD(P)-binding protein [Stellaceae bacterium]